MKRLLIIIVVLFFNQLLIANDKNNRTQEDEFPSPVSYHPLHYDIDEYELFFVIPTLASKEVFGETKIKLKSFDFNKSNKFYFHLRGLQVDSVEYLNQLIDFKEVGNVDDSIYHYECTLPNLSQDEHYVTIYYHGEMTTEYNHRTTKWGGVQYRDSILYSMGVGFYNNYVSATQHWLACLDLPFDKAKFKVYFDVPKGVIAVSNGKLIDIDTNNKKRNYFVWQHDYDCATYNLTFALGPFEKVEMFYDSIPLVIYGKPNLKENIEKSFKYLPEMVNLYSEKFGEYPFEKVGFVLTPTGSMEHQTLISIAEKLYKYNPDTLNLTAAHELAHMWFGDCVTPYDFRDAWLNESFATFCEALWQEYFLGRQDYLDQLEYYRSYYIANKYGSKFEGVFPLYDFPRDYPSSNYPLTIYYKGAVVVNMLRYELGDSLFFGALKEYISRRKYSNANTDTLKAILEDYSQKDLTDFFEQWVYGKGWAEINAIVEKVGTNCKLILTQHQPKDWGYFKNVPIELGFVTTQDDTIFKMVTLNEGVQNFNIDVGAEFYPEKITINQGPTVRSLIQVNNITTGVFEDISKEVEIYPNPSDSQIIINYPADEGSSEIKVFNIKGNLIKSIITKSIKGENNYTLYTNDMEQGSYYLIIRNKLGVFKNYFRVVR